MGREIGKDSRNYLLLLVWELRDEHAPWDNNTNRGKEEVCPGKTGPTLQATLAIKGLNTAKVGNILLIFPRMINIHNESNISSGYETPSS